MELGLGLGTRLMVAAILLDLSATAAPASVESSGSKPPKTIAWSEIGATANAQYAGGGLAVTQTEQGAKLHCVFQRLIGEATREGLWLASTVSEQPTDRFCVTAVAVAGQTLSMQGEILVTNQLVRFVRDGLIEEYSVSMDGVRQDFIVLEKALSTSNSQTESNKESLDGLRLELAVAGAAAEQVAYGAQLVLKQSGRKIAYSRLRATDANGKELRARIEVANSSKTEIQTPNSEIALVVVVDDSNAVYPVRIDPTFSDANWISMNPSIPGANWEVYAAVVDDSGNLFIGGHFTVVSDIIASRVAKWNGSAWSALGSGITNGYVYALAVSGSDVYAGGDFGNAGGSAARGVAKWDGNSWSGLGSGIEYGPVYALAVSGSDVYAGGWFPGAIGTGANSIAKWNGNAWSALGSGMNSQVYALAVLGGDLYAGGQFTTAGGNAASKVAKWDGSAWSALGSGMNGTVYALAVLGNDVYAGGAFTTAGGNPASKVAKWGSNAWSALGSGMNSVGHVSTLLVSGSNVYAGGDFNMAGGSPANRTAKWDGSAWSAVGSGINDDVRALAMLGSDLYAGGKFTTAGGVAANYIAKWNGSAWTAPALGMNWTVKAIAVSGTDVYAGGYFSTAGNVAANGIAKWDGNSWSALSTGINSYGYVFALAVSGNCQFAGKTSQGFAGENQPPLR